LSPPKQSLGNIEQILSIIFSISASGCNSTY
jgi:hypothetical protein